MLMIWVCVQKGNLSCGFEKREVKGKKGRGPGVRVMCVVQSMQYMTQDKLNSRPFANFNHLVVY